VPSWKLARRGAKALKPPALSVGLFFGRLYHLMHAPTMVHARDDDEDSAACECMTQSNRPLYRRHCMLRVSTAGGYCGSSQPQKATQVG
jgi:hypothetical protein